MFRSALADKKAELLRRAARIVMGTAAVSFVEDETEKRRVLQLLMENYTGRDDRELPQGLVDHVHAIRLTVEGWPAKRH